MRHFTPYQLWYGRDEAPVEPRTLRAGPVTVQLWGPDLRYLRRNEREIVRRLYIAVRDANWNTLPGTVSDWQPDIAEDHFQVGFTVRHRQDSIDFSWRGTITGTNDGTICYDMDGIAGTDFRYNRIGCCVLHPAQEAAGRAFQGQTPEGAISGTLPLPIGPQRLENGTYIALFPAVSELAIAMEDDLTVRFQFEGDLFEMEDQRNWTDASFKTYCTPLALPFPKQARAGQSIRQQVSISTEQEESVERLALSVKNRAEEAHQEETRSTLNATPLIPRMREEGRSGSTLNAQCLMLNAQRSTLLHPGSLPALGLGMASHEEPLSEREIALLRSLHPAHLRVDLYLHDRNYPQVLERARQAATALGCSLELALTLTDAAEQELSALAAHLPLPLARILVFHEQAQTTEGRWVRLARERLGEWAAGVPFIGGANAYFCELNRCRPEMEAMDGIVYSINPQVHAFDEASLMETFSAQADTVTSARAFSGDRPVIVSPVTLKPRFNANMTEPEPLTPPGQLPRPVDPRQMSLFGAAWTLGSIQALAMSGAASVTYYETTGWRGVMETEKGSPLPERFPSEAGTVFPLYHVFADIAEWRGGELCAGSSPDPLRVLMFSIRDAEGGPHLLLANVTPVPQAVVVGSLETERLLVRRLNAETALFAMREPERFRAAKSEVAITDGRWETTLEAYETVRIDVM